MQHFLIAGLGNPEQQYTGTRHNIGFDVIDALSAKLESPFEKTKLGWIADGRHKGKKITLLKPDTYMNLSGKAISYYMQLYKMPTEQILVITDDLALPFGTIRIKPKGSDGGHNGLHSIIEHLGHNNFARLRFGIGSNFAKGRQVDYVLGKWDAEENKLLPERISLCCEAILAFALSGISFSMTAFNGK
ncbi:MAG: aminoacyl-tRNA hydrolase [Bacteroidota bacterium]|jgi:PTH1 family peptidyl-tRNA hydrolase